MMTTNEVLELAAQVRSTYATLLQAVDTTARNSVAEFWYGTATDVESLKAQAQLRTDAAADAPRVALLREELIRLTGAKTLDEAYAVGWGVAGTYVGMISRFERAADAVDAVAARSEFEFWTNVLRDVLPIERPSVQPAPKPAICFPFEAFRPTVNTVLS